MSDLKIPEFKSADEVRAFVLSKCAEMKPDEPRVQHFNGEWLVTKTKPRLASRWQSVEAFLLNARQPRKKAYEAPRVVDSATVTLEELQRLHAQAVTRVNMISAETLVDVLKPGTYAFTKPETLDKVSQPEPMNAKPPTPVGKGPRPKIKFFDTDCPPAQQTKSPALKVRKGYIAVARKADSPPGTYQVMVCVGEPSTWMWYGAYLLVCFALDPKRDDENIDFDIYRDVGRDPLMMLLARGVAKRGVFERLSESYGRHAWFDLTVTAPRK